MHKNGKTTKSRNLFSFVQVFYWHSRILLVLKLFMGRCCLPQLNLVWVCMNVFDFFSVGTFKLYWRLLWILRDTRRMMCSSRRSSTTSINVYCAVHTKQFNFLVSLLLHLHLPLLLSCFCSGVCPFNLFILVVILCL